MDHDYSNAGLAHEDNAQAVRRSLHFSARTGMEGAPRVRDSDDIIAYICEGGGLTVYQGPNVVGDLLVCHGSLHTKNGL